MDFDEYQEKAKDTDLGTLIGGSHLIYTILGLANESGEVLGKLKKLYRDHNGELTEEYKNNMSKELGDILWYLAMTAETLGLKLSDIAEKNITKLASRKERNQIQGSGDDR